MVLENPHHHYQTQQQLCSQGEHLQSENTHHCRVIGHKFEILEHKAMSKNYSCSKHYEESEFLYCFNANISPSKLQSQYKIERKRAL